MVVVVDVFLNQFVCASRFSSMSNLSFLFHSPPPTIHRASFKQTVTMAKRRNVDGQMRREEYEALEKEREEDSSGNDGLAQGFQKASADVMKKRRIVRVSR